MAVVGSRELGGADTIAQVRAIVAHLLGIYRPRRVISGGARGVDTIAINTARSLQYDTTVFPPPKGARRWEDFRPRDERIAQECTQLVCIRTHASTTYGSGWTRDYARDELHKPTWSIMLPYDGVIDWRWDQEREVVLR